MRKIFMALLIGVSSLMAQAAIKDNKVLTDFIEREQAEMTKDGVGTMAVESGLFGEMIVATFKVPEPLGEFIQLPQNIKDAMKTSMIQAAKKECPISKEVIKAMKQENATFVLRMSGTDGSTYDIYLTPDDLK